MRAYTMRLAAAAWAGAMLGALGLAGTGMAGLVARPSPRTPGATAAHAPATAGAQLWAARYNGPGSGLDAARSVAVSPGGAKVFVTGVSGSAAATVAYNAITGRQLWVKRYTGPVGGRARADAVAVSPGGGKVFVAGTSTSATTGEDYVVIAYNATTGARLWLRHYNGPANGTDDAFALAVRPGGSAVYVTGRSWGAGSGADYATVAYDAATGKPLWIRRYTGTGSRYDSPNSRTVGPGGHRLIVTGVSAGVRTGDDYATVAYDAATGKQLWVQRYDGHGPEGDAATSAVIGPDGAVAYVTGTSNNTATTIAYNAGTGTQLWTRHYAGPNDIGATGVKVAPGPRAGAVYVTGIAGRVVSDDYATIAYNSATGARLWVRLYDGPARTVDDATALAVSPSGHTVYVTGYSSGGPSTAEDYATVAYNAATGKPQWVHRYNGPASSGDIAAAIAVSPGGSRVFVTGQSIGARTPDYFSGLDYLTVAYQG